MMGLINRIEPSAQRARVSADQLPHWGSSVTTSRMTLLSTRMAVIGDQPRVRARISSVLIRVEALPRIRASVNLRVLRGEKRCVASIGAHHLPLARQRQPDAGKIASPNPLWMAGIEPAASGLKAQRGIHLHQQAKSS